MKLAICGATKNTFIFIADEQLIGADWPEQVRGITRSELAQELCHRVGMRADGVVFVKDVKENPAYEYSWDFYNRDGSSAEMCGNAARCMAYFVTEYLGHRGSEVSFLTLAGRISVLKMDRHNFSVKMPEHTIVKLDCRDEKLGIRYSFINTGVPHAVIKVSEIDPKKLLSMVENFRFRTEFGPAGANVSFFCEETNGTYSGITFERGVENFTASCGTGVVAMALVILEDSHLKSEEIRRVEIKTPGGVLAVTKGESDRFCWLSGPAGLEEEIHLY